jgi:hypothetical protein
MSVVLSGLGLALLSFVSLFTRRQIKPSSAVKSFKYSFLFGLRCESRTLKIEDQAEGVVKTA